MRIDVGKQALSRPACASARFDATMQRHKLYIGEFGDDMPEILASQEDEQIALHTWAFLA